MVEYAPPVVVDALMPVIDEVLSQRSRTLLTVGMLATIWAASSGAQAVRTALNKAYGVEQGLTFWRARIKVTVFTVIGTVAAVLVFSSVVILPYALALLDQTIGVGAGSLWLRTGIRYGLAFGVLVLTYAILYGWLPDIPQRLRTVAPGAVCGALMWLGAAAVLSYHAAQRRPARGGVWQLHRPRGDARVPVCQRGHPDLRSRDQRRAARPGEPAGPRQSGLSRLERGRPLWLDGTGGKELHGHASDRAPRQALWCA